MVSTSFRAASSEVEVASSLLWARRAPGNARLGAGGGGEGEEGEEQEEEEEVKVTLRAALMFSGAVGPESREQSGGHREVTGRSQGGHTEVTRRSHGGRSPE